MNSDHHQRSRLTFGLVFGVLFAFWVAVAVCIAAVVIASAWDARDGGVSAAAPTAAASATPVPTPSPDERPPAVPATAEPLAGEFDSGEPERHLFFALSCTDDVLTLITTDERVYAETACPEAIDPVFIQPFQGDDVRTTIAGGSLDIVTPDGERLTFPVARVWIDAR